MMMSAAPASTSERLHHPNERLMMMSAASLTARGTVFDDDVGGAFLHERAAALPERVSDDGASGEFDDQGCNF